MELQLNSGCQFVYEFGILNFTKISLISIANLVINNEVQVYSYGWIFAYNFIAIWLKNIIDKLNGFDKIDYLIS